MFRCGMALRREATHTIADISLSRKGRASVKMRGSRSTAGARASLSADGLHLQADAVTDHGDELAVGRFPLGVGHGIAKKTLEGLQVAPVPGHLDGVPDRALHPAGG